MLRAARPFRSAPTLAAVLALVLQPGIASASQPAGSGVEIKVGRADGFSRIELHGARPSSVRRDGRDLVLRFPRSGVPDMARLHVDPPPHVQKAELRTVASAVELRLTPTADAEVRTGWADGATWINFTPSSGAAPTRAPTIDPTPSAGVLAVTGEAAGGALRLRFPWRAPLGAAVFRRGAAVWVVFDGVARMDLSSAPRGLPLARKLEAVSGPGWSGVRITSPAAVPVSASAEGGRWTVTLGSAPGATAPDEVRLDQDETGAPALAAHLAGARSIVWLSDPAVGDRIAAVTALPPAKGLPDAHGVVGAELLPSAQGLAIRAVADDLQVSVDGDIVRVGRPRGLALSPPGAQRVAKAPAPTVDLPQAASSPGFVDFAAWSRAGAGGFRARYADLLFRASLEEAQGRGAPSVARMALARFLVGSELSFEAIGVLNAQVRADPRVAVDPEFRGLRGAARAMAGRWADAQADFSTPVTADDPASSLWRGYAAWRLGDMAGAAKAFAAGRSAEAAFTPKWRARFVRGDAESAAAQGDLGLARRILASVPNGGLEREEADGLTLTAARLAEASGDRDGALRLYQQAARSPLDALAAPALLKATQIRLAAGTLASGEAAATLDSLRFRWRGDAVELETVRALGRINLEQGRYREALTVLRSANGRLPSLPAAADLQADLQSAFKTLFLEGQADGLQPIQALALFYDFKELTPIGTDGDLMVRRLVRRLVDVDLLDQAADLLRYQVDNRLDGVGRAQVATDLALIDVMARRPEAALGALNDTRSTLLPAALNAQRRVLEARALLDLGRTDHALEVLGKDSSPDAAEVRALAAWRGRDWAGAARFAEARLGDRWRDPRPLDSAEASLLLRAGTAYSLAQDDAALARLRARFAALADGSAQPDALRVALAGLTGASPGAGLGAALAQAQSDAGVFAGWVTRMKARFRAPAAAPVVKTSAPTPMVATAPRRA